MENKSVLVFSGFFSVLSERQSVPLASTSRASPLSRQQPASAVPAARPVASLSGHQQAAEGAAATGEEEAAGGAAPAQGAGEQE